MIILKKLMTLARKWWKMASIGRKRISLPRTSKDVGSSNRSSVAEKGHFIIYIIDQRSYVVSLVYLSSNIFRELLKMSEKEFGISSDRPITLPCDAVYMDCIDSPIKHGVAKGLENAFHNSITSSLCISLLLFLKDVLDNNHWFAATERKKKKKSCSL